MKEVRRATAGTKITTEMYNELVDAVNNLQQLSVGTGLEMRQTSAGTCISLGTVGASPNYYAPYRTLLQTTAQDADSWSTISAGGSGIAYSIYSDLYFDTSNYTLTSRQRQVRYDNKGFLVYTSPETTASVLGASGAGTATVVTNVWLDGDTLKQSKATVTGLINSPGSGEVSNVFIGQMCDS
ncbi:MAG: hypothetical protein ACYC27_18740 [Armatimonadota bacterium]